MLETRGTRFFPYRLLFKRLVFFSKSNHWQTVNERPLVQRFIWNYINKYGYFSFNMIHQLLISSIKIFKESLLEEDEFSCKCKLYIRMMMNQKNESYFYLFSKRTEKYWTIFNFFSLINYKISQLTKYTLLHGIYFYYFYEIKRKSLYFIIKFFNYCIY